MREQLIKARDSIKAGNVEAAAEVASWIRSLPRTREGVFDTSALGLGIWEAAGYLYPVYMAYETECNGKAGYPDLRMQWRVLDGKLQRDEQVSFLEKAFFLDALIDTIDCVSIQLYEYYRELVDIFRRNVKNVIEMYYRDGHFVPENAAGEDGISGNGQPSGAELSLGEKLIREAIGKACENHVLLGEKYAEYRTIEETGETCGK